MIYLIQIYSRVPTYFRNNFHTLPLYFMPLQLIVAEWRGLWILSVTWPRGGPLGVLEGKEQVTLKPTAHESPRPQIRKAPSGGYSADNQVELEKPCLQALRVLNKQIRGFGDLSLWKDLLYFVYLLASWLCFNVKIDSYPTNVKSDFKHRGNVSPSQTVYSIYTKIVESLTNPLFHGDGQRGKRRILNSNRTYTSTSESSFILRYCRHIVFIICVCIRLSRLYQWLPILSLHAFYPSQVPWPHKILTHPHPLHQIL